MHSIYLDSHGTLKGLDLSCETCLVHYWCENVTKRWIKQKKITNLSVKKYHQETISIKVKKVQGEVMVTSEEFGVREEFGTTDTDEYQIVL